MKKVTGKIILPELYTAIKVVDDFIIASEQIDGNFRIRDTLFNIEGEAILEGAYRRIGIDSYDSTIIFETPSGMEHCNIINC